MVNKDKLSMLDIQKLCYIIEGGLATSTPDFIDSCIKAVNEEKYGYKDTVDGISLLKRLNNIKKDLLEDE